MVQFVHARLTEGRDEDLIAWLESLPDRDRSAAIRHTLRAGLGVLSQQENEMAGLIRRAVQDAMVGVMVVGEPIISTFSNEVEDGFGNKLDGLLGGFG